MDYTGMVHIYALLNKYIPMIAVKGYQLQNLSSIARYYLKHKQTNKKENEMNDSQVKTNMSIANFFSRNTRPKTLPVGFWAIVL